jgi:hypothetical protein
VVSVAAVVFAAARYMEVAFAAVVFIAVIFTGVASTAVSLTAVALMAASTVVDDSCDKPRAKDHAGIHQSVARFASVASLVAGSDKLKERRDRQWRRPIARADKPVRARIPKEGAWITS